MGVAQVYAGLTANGGHLNLESCTYVGFQKTYSASSYITDSGASATVPVFAYGPGAESFAGIYENTDIFEKMAGLLELD